MFYQTLSLALRGAVQALIRIGGERGYRRRFFWTVFQAGDQARRLSMRTLRPVPATIRDQRAQEGILHECSRQSSPPVPL